MKNGDGLGTKTAALVREMGRLDHCVLACDLKRAAEAKAVAPEMKICNMSRQVGTRRDYVDATIAQGSDFIQMTLTQGLAGMADDVKRLHQHGVKCNWFGTEDPALIRKLADMGIDYILTDNLDVCLRVLAEKR